MGDTQASEALRQIVETKLAMDRADQDKKKRDRERSDTEADAHAELVDAFGVVASNQNDSVQKVVLLEQKWEALQTIRESNRTEKKADAEFVSACKEAHEKAFSDSRQLKMFE